MTDHSSDPPTLLGGFVPWLVRTLILSVVLGVLLFLAWLALGFL